MYIPTLQKQDTLCFFYQFCFQLAIDPHRSGSLAIYVLILDIFLCDRTHILYLKCLFMSQYFPENDRITFVEFLHFVIIVLLIFFHTG